MQRRITPIVVKTLYAAISSWMSSAKQSREVDPDPRDGAAAPRSNREDIGYVFRSLALPIWLDNRRADHPDGHRYNHCTVSFDAANALIHSRRVSDWIWDRRSALRPIGAPYLNGLATFRDRRGTTGNFRLISGYDRQRRSPGFSGR